MVQAICPNVPKIHGFAIDRSLAMYLSDIGQELILVDKGGHAGSGLFVLDYILSLNDSSHPRVTPYPSETHQQAAKKQKPSKAYVEGLENRVETLERLLRQFMPPEDFTKEVGSSSPTREKVTDTTPRLQGALLVDKVFEQMQRTDEVVPRTEAAKEAHRDSDELFLSDSITKLAISRDLRFYGKSSSAVFLLRALDMGREYTKELPNATHVDFLGRRRPKYWQTFSWELDFIRKFEPPSYMFPEQDLLQDLVDLYFNHINIFIPLLHRPTFLRQLQQELHLREEGFGAVVLLVCANASRFSSDPRVRLDGEESWLSAGWKWFNQVQLVRKALLSPPSLHDLQIYYLLCQFLQGTSVTQASWTMIGTCLRLAQDAGAHRKNMIGKTTVEDELMKRAFWAMVYMDYSISAASGKPCGLQEEDYDLDLPIECDDEYWEHPDPEQAWHQPHGKPSTVSFFVSLLKLVKILALALRTIYSISKSRSLLGLVGPQWQQRIVTELDSALNKWVDTVPGYLRWDPSRDNDVFFRQSAELYTEYYLLQVLIHRQFIPSPKQPSPLSFPSLAICTNAARSCIRIADIQRRRTGTLSPSSIGAVFSCGIILLLNIWEGRRSGVSGDPTKDMADVHKCMEALRSSENRWHAAGRLWDILCGLTSVGELPPPQISSTATNKRARDEDSPNSATTVSEGSSPRADNEPRNIAGTRRVMRASTSTPGSSTQATQQNVSPLPMYSDELGRLPVYGQHMTQADWAQLDDGAGVWFPSMGMVPSTSSAIDGSMTYDNAAVAPGAIPTMNGAQFPLDFPTLADAEFFDHLASISWTTNGMENLSSSYYGEGGPNPSSSSHQPGQAPVGVDATSMWSETPSGFGFG
ncbi:Gypsy retrotransposon integrase-like protein 1 [Marasmius sp. AFHP31]|nr:Gypsy retrotransposon integrase-like protein 1 [Marasmius sp. AFHP31]